LNIVHTSVISKINSLLERFWRTDPPETHAHFSPIVHHTSKSLPSANFHFDEFGILNPEKTHIFTKCSIPANLKPGNPYFENQGRSYVMPFTWSVNRLYELDTTDFSLLPQGTKIEQVKSICQEH
jgi:hypothetical protein